MTEGKKYLSRDDVFAAEDRVIEEVHVPEWGGWMRVRSLSGAERDALEQSMVVIRGKEREQNLVAFRQKLIARSVVDDQGKRIFSDADVADLGKKSAAALDRVASVAVRVSKMTPEDVEELTKNFGSDQSEDSGTD